ncbi:MAG: DNA translocase FtsK [Verrucomicrobiales bacterium]|nr:DNA translocase FtsK [Verrucomicrobiae bacterium]
MAEKGPARERKTLNKPKQKQHAATGPYAWSEGIAISLGGVAIMHLLALISYSPHDLPSWVPFCKSYGSGARMENFIGPVGAVIAGYSYWFFGAAAYLLPVILAWWGLQTLNGCRFFHSRNVTALVVALFAGSCLIEYQGIFFQDWVALYNLPKSAGGFVGFGIGRKILEALLGIVGATLVSGISYLIAMIVITGIHPFRFALMVKDELVIWWEERKSLAEMLARSRAGDWREERKASRVMAAPLFEDEPVQPSYRRTARKKKEAPEELDHPIDTASLIQAELDLESPKPEPVIIDTALATKRTDGPDRLDPSAVFASWRNRKGADSSDGLVSNTGKFDNYQLPNLNLLRYADISNSRPVEKSELLETQQNIIDTLGTFGIDVSAGDITRGPTITRYEIYPSKGLRVNRISALEADIARATKAERINILAPIPGKDTVGIEIANARKVPVVFRDLLEDEEFRSSDCKIPLALGKDVYGKTIVGDLAKMPHLLVAGTTGSGKSVCINGIIASLLYRFTPDELRFIMVDPKFVEMQQYNVLPHMVIPVVTETKKVLLALAWVIKEMERRYAIFAKCGCRNLDAFNQRKIEEPAETEAVTTSPARASRSAKSKSVKVAVDPLRGGFAEEEAELILADSPEEDWDLEEEGEEWSEDDAETTPVADDWNDESAPETRAEPFFMHQVQISNPQDIPDDLPFDIDGPDDTLDEDLEGEEDDLAPVFASVPRDGDAIPEQLPYIVVIIDELADLMQTAPADVETSIARIAQKARAAGIHLIVATQTPRADVVTGIIKANIPSRIAFQVASKIDSRVILDAPGADRLVGKGDMLYLPPGSSQLIRAQGALIADEDLQKVVDFCAGQAEPDFEHEVHDSISGGGESEEEVSEADEELLDKCLEVIFQEKKASTSLLQRRLRLGYTRAARMVDILEQRGIVGPGEGAKPREILIDLSSQFD